MATENGSKLLVVDRREDRPPTPSSVTPMDLLRIATSQGADTKRLEKLMELQMRWEREQARKAYAAALAQFKANPPQIIKNKHVHFGTKSGDKMDYWHATHDEVCNKVSAALAPFGLSHSWRTSQKDGMIFVKCIISHAMGHSEEFELFGAPDKSGLKSDLQAIASTTTFLQRYTLLGALGLSSEEMREADDDATKKPAEPAPEGWEAWQTDMTSLADEGLEKLTAAWSASKPEFRRYVVKYAEPWWLEIKTRAKNASYSGTVS